MGKTTRQAVKTAVGILAAASCVAALAGNLSRDTLLSWGQGLALFSVGLRQPEGGAEALNGYLERQPANAGTGTSSSVDEPGTPSTTVPGTTPSTPDTDQEGIRWPELPVVPETPIPEQTGKGGIVREEQMSSGDHFVEGVAIRNKSSTQVDIAEILAHRPDIHITDTDEPQVLIMHTHTTECYMAYDAGFYNETDLSRTQDETKNVVAVGEVIAAQLRAAGIGVIHDTTVHDYPKYNGAYDRSKETVQKNLQQYPTIQVVLDIHRDAIMRDSSTKVKPTVEIDGKKAAQMMIIAGMLNTSSTPHPDWRENLSLGMRLQQTLHTTYEGLMRPLSMVDSRYNQQLTHGSLLVEMGSEANTLQEALYSGQMLGRALAEVLGSLKS